MISDETIERVREAADIVQIIGEHVNLKRSGADFRGPCPFHQGTHRNFSVSPKKGIYYCFVCHEGGDVFTFLQKRLGMEWPAAVRHVAERVGIEVREVETRTHEKDAREPFWELNAAAAAYVREMLWDENIGKPARDYLALRRVSREIADRFGLGFAPRDLDAMREHLNALGYDDARLAEAGLLVTREETNEQRPRFRNRLIFPIHDASGHHVGFGGRLLGPGEPKYLNSADSPIFSKSRVLYGLNWAKHAIRREDRVVVVEGYFDAVRLWSAGLDPVVAPLGTALTEQQASMLARYTRTAFLLYDSDRAGLKATFRAGDELLRHGFAVQVVTLPEGEDPDSFVDRHGADALREQLDQSVDVFERKVQLLERAGWFADLRRKRRALDRLLPTLRATADALTRDMYLTRASEAAGVAKNLLAREVDAATGGASGRTRYAGPGPTPEMREAPPSVEPGRSPARDRRAHDRRTRGRGESAERELVRVMVHERGQVDALAERVDPAEFQNAELREIFQTLVKLGDEVSIDELSSGLSPAAVEELQALLDEPDATVDMRRTIDDSLVVLRKREMKTRMVEITRMLPLASGEEKDELIVEKTKLQREMQTFGTNDLSHSGKSRS
ncbi:MAG TPA: DNA primase [Candidatus Limnocylindria bacterium]|nr:DNA primase [Candidatus Limnocylindria bacterium]